MFAVKVCSIISPALSLLIKQLVIGKRQKAPNFSAFHRSPHGSLVSISQHFVTTRVVHLPERTETSLITESGQAVRSVHSCNSCFSTCIITKVNEPIRRCISDWILSIWKKKKKKRKLQYATACLQLPFWSTSWSRKLFKLSLEELSHFHFAFFFQASSTLRKDFSLATSSRKANRKSQKLSFLVKTVDKYGVEDILTA